MPLVSVIMPSYNHERFISESIESVLGQSFNDLELIIIDDASEDNSKHIIDEFSKKDYRIKKIFHQKNMGIARTMNDGIEAAKGKFIAFTASDDVWVKDKLEKEVKVLEKNEDCVVWTEVEIIDADGSPTGKLGTQRWGASNRRKSGDIFDELLRGNFISNRILKKENLRNIRFNEALRYLSDWQFDVDLARRYIYYFIPEPLVKKREQGSNTAQRDRQGYIKDRMPIEQYFLNEYLNDMSNTTKSGICFRMAQHYRELGNNDISNVTNSRIYLQMAQYYRELGLAAENPLVLQLQAQLDEKVSEIKRLELQIWQMQHSITMQVSSRHHRAVEKLLRSGTRRRYYYELGLSGIRIILNEGWLAFFRKAIHWFRQKLKTQG